MDKSNNPPFMSESGQSNIDITLATQNLKHAIKWEVDSSCTISDNNLIIIELQGGVKTQKLEPGPWIQYEKSKLAKV